MQRQYIMYSQFFPRFKHINTTKTKAKNKTKINGVCCIYNKLGMADTFLFLYFAMFENLIVPVLILILIACFVSTKKNPTTKPSTYERHKTQIMTCHNPKHKPTKKIAQKN